MTVDKTTIVLGRDTRKRLFEVATELQLRRGKPITAGNAVDTLITEYRARNRKKL